MSENLVVGFIGNPNCGKTTLFNAFTGVKLKSKRLHLSVRRWQQMMS